MKPVIDENGVKHPSAEHLRLYKNWRHGHGMLGDPPQTALDEIVREYLQEKHDACGGDAEKIKAFLRAHDSLFNECWDRIERYHRQVTQYRHEHGMRPFDWRLEKRSSIRGILRAKKGNNVLPVTALKREHWAAMQAAQNADIPLCYQRFKTLKSTAEILGGDAFKHLFEKDSK